MKAVVDRLEDNYAVVSFGDEKIQVSMPTKLLPRGVYQGCWLKVLISINHSGPGKRMKMDDLLDWLSGSATISKKELNG